MTKHVFCERTGASVDKFLLPPLDHLIEANNKGWDGFYLIDGMEGSGKTTLAFITAYYLNRRFNLANVVFTPEQFIEAVDRASPGTAIVWDEFVMAGLSTDFMSKIQRTILSKMVVMRKKRLYICLVIPYLWILRRYFAIARPRFLLHTYTPDGIQRGIWWSYYYDRKRDLYMKGLKTMEYFVPPNRKGRFVDFWKWGVIDPEAYDKKKEEALLTIGGREEDKYNRKVIARKLKDKGLSYADISDCFGVTDRTVRRWLSEDKALIDMMDI